MYKRDIYLDIDDELNNYIKSVELDSNSRVWHFHLTVDYEPLDLTGKSVHFIAEKPDKTNVLNDCKIVDAEKGVVEVKLTRQVNAIPGHVKCLLKIIGDEGFVLKTKTFVVDVSKTLSDDAIVSSDEFGALEAALGKVQDVDNRFAQIDAQLSEKANQVEINVLYPPKNITPVLQNDRCVVDKILNMINELDCKDITLLFPQGEYNFEKALKINFVNLNKNISFKGDEGTIFVKKGACSIFNVEGYYELEKNVTSIDETRTIISYDSEYDSIDIEEGDVLHITSDDIIPNRRYETFEGEFVVVKSAQHNQIELAGCLRPDFVYETNVKLRKMCKNKLIIDGIQVRDDVDASTKETNSMILIKKLYRPKIINTCNIFSKNAFINIRECYGYLIDNCNSEKQLDIDGYLGYGVTDSGCGFGILRNSTFKNCRHAFTTNSNTDGRGETHYTVIENCRAIGTSSNSFDTHENGYKIVFDSNTVNNCRGSAFSSRTSATFTNCKCYNSNIGFYFFNNNKEDKSCDDIELINCITNGTIDFTIKICENVTNIRFINCLFSGKREIFLELCNNISFTNCVFTSTDYNVNVRSSASKNIMFEKCSFENQASTEKYVFKMSLDAEVKVIDCCVRNSDEQTVLVFGSDGTNNILKMKNMLIDGSIKTIPASDNRPMRGAETFSHITMDYELL